MTILDFLQLVKRHLRLMIIIPVVCMVVSVVVLLFMPSNYSATASFITNGDVVVAQSMASREAGSYSNTNVSLSTSYSSTAKQVSVTASGADPNLCVEAANTVMNNAMKQYGDANNSAIMIANEANMATNNKISMSRVVLVALLIGLLIDACIVVLFDIVRSPIKSKEDAEACSQLPIIGTIPSPKAGERIFANLQFNFDGRPATIAVVPVGAAIGAIKVAEELADAMERSNVRVKLVKGSPNAKRFNVNVPEDASIIVSCESLDAGMGAAYIAHCADTTILSAVEWTDSRKQLASTVQELDLAKAKVAGIVCLPEEQGGQHRERKGK